MRVNALLDRRHEYRVLGLMLLVLHGGMWWDFAGPVSSSLMLAHLGLFLLWQPIWHREERLKRATAAVSVVTILILVAWLDWWMVTVWLVILSGLVGGRMTEGRAERTVYMVTLVFLVCELLIGAIPAMFGVRMWDLVEQLARYGLPVLAFVVMLISAADTTRKTDLPVDFLYGLTMSLLVSVLAMGSLLRMYDAGVSYPIALFQSTLSIAAFLLAISWLWMPLGGFSGLGQLWTRYLMNIGTPFERWLAGVATQARHMRTPEDFVGAAMGELVELPWVHGSRWKRDNEEQMVGEVSEHSFSVRDGDLEITVYTFAPVGPALALHGKLLVGLLAQFLRAKEREQELTNRAQVEAVYETGARITHDIKNLLQSLYSLTSAMASVKDDRGRREVQGLLERQLPALSARLSAALDKLQAPEVGPERRLPASRWWAELQRRNAGEDVHFTDRLAADPAVPADLFDSVADNLLENARFKRLTDPATEIRVAFEADEDGVMLRVRDTGMRPSRGVARRLLKAPVRSRSGLGIGLYQARRRAEELGYALEATSLEDGNVAFELRSEPPPQASAAAE